MYIINPPTRDETVLKALLIAFVMTIRIKNGRLIRTGILFLFLLFVFFEKGEGRCVNEVEGVVVYCGVVV